MYFIGIDLGTSGLRAILVDQYGSFVASSEAKYKVTNKNPGWSEQDPEDWIIDSISENLEDDEQLVSINIVAS